VLAVTLRPATSADRAFVESTYFESHRWVIERLFGRRGDAVERRKFAERYDEGNSSIVVVEGQDAGWLSVSRKDDAIELSQIYLSPDWQNRGIGTFLIRRLIDEAAASSVPLRLSTAKINPARRLYERLGFRVITEFEFKVVMEMTHPILRDVCSE
jgi:GNAT superfamily N-acetyltransferase